MTSGNSSRWTGAASGWLHPKNGRTLVKAGNIRITRERDVNLGAYGRDVGVRAPEAEASQQGWMIPQVASQWMHGTFHPESGWDSLESWGKQRAIQPGATPGWREESSRVITPRGEPAAWPGTGG